VLELDTVSDPVVDLEIPRMCQELCRTLHTETTCAPWLESLQAALEDVLRAWPHLKLGDPQRSLQVSS
jgi:hypothetical protein